MKETQQGNRKVILTKWLLIIFSVGTVLYLLLLGLRGEVPPDSFFMNLVLGLGAIGGAFTAGNIFEHRAAAQKEVTKKMESNKEPASS
ncbi:hypothetical protein [Reinekea sp. G2M2-21]|uniref:hypothetical protein n=1 Tax=Reinekea sp. G2M2-21 TaxID=2788942 RepID=UPI0018AAE026|nr:hypothetical protein [Reinekea sp. G2M2-21]